ncbi:MAG: Rrf2 family transcriptional regulator [Abditibacteriales bacterium]|nr:Rrf2 family transcriptional regulator [Abditibacteriales bacterium]MDW8367130.1 Rrf2 family transcriptional regulator [Abditibacteriales bacterium]
MLYSRLCQYGIWAMVELSEEQGEPRSAESLAAVTHLPAPTMAKVLSELVRAKLVTSHRGPGGGFRLAKPPEEITLEEIVRAIDRGEVLEGCLMGLPMCGDVTACPLHSRWKEVREGIRRFLQTTTLADIVTAARLRRSPSSPVAS